MNWHSHEEGPGERRRGRREGEERGEGRGTVAVAEAEGLAGRVAGRTSTYRRPMTLRPGSRVGCRASGSPNHGDRRPRGDHRGRRAGRRERTEDGRGRGPDQPLPGGDPRRPGSRSPKRLRPATAARSLGRASWAKSCTFHPHLGTGDDPAPAARAPGARHPGRCGRRPVPLRGARLGGQAGRRARRFAGSRISATPCPRSTSSVPKDLSSSLRKTGVLTRPARRRGDPGVVSPRILRRTLRCGPWPGQRSR